MPGARRKLLRNLMLTLLIFGFLILAGIDLLLSSFGSGWLLGRARDLAKSRYNTEVDYTNGEFHLLSGFDFKNLHIHVKRQGLETDAEISHIHLDYSLNIFSRILTIHSLQVESPHLKMKKSSSPRDEAQSFSGEPSSRLPIDIRLEKAVITALALDMSMAGEENVDVHISSARFRFASELRSEEMSSQGEFDLGEGAHLSGKGAHSSFGGSGKWDLVFAFKPTLELRKNLTRADFFMQNFKLLERAQAITFKSAEISVSSSLDSQMELAFDSRLNQLAWSGKLVRPAAVAFHGDFKAGPRFDAGEGRLDFKLFESRILALRTQFTRGGEKIQFSGQLEGQTHGKDLSRLFVNDFLHANPALDFHTEFQGRLDSETLDLHSLSKVPKLRIGSTELDVELDQDSHWKRTKRELASKLELMIASKAYGRWQVQSDVQAGPASSQGLRIQGNTVLNCKKKGEDLPLAFSEPWQFNYEFIKRPHGSLDGSLKAEVPKLSLPNLAELAPMRFQFEARSAEANAKNVGFHAHLDESSVHLAARPDFALAGLNVDIQGQVHDGNLLDLTKLSIELDHRLMRIKGEGAGNIANRDLQLKSEVSFNFPAESEMIPGQKFSGQVTLPFSLTVVRGDLITLLGHIRFNDFSWRKGDLGLGQINGEIPLSEKLKWDGKNIRFTQLIRENPFERVDFNRVRPLLNSKEQLRFETLSWKDKAYGPFVGFMSLNQNMIAAHQFDMDLLGARAYGELFMNFYPRNLQVGFLGRLTDLNLTDFLPKQYLKGQDAHSRDLSARAGVVCNLNRATLEGRIDVTEIGGRQLTTLINILDPEYNDEKMNKIRSLLQVGYPVAVNAAFNEGFMDMDVDLKILSLLTRESVHGIPLSDFISKATSSLLEKSEKGIIQ